MTRKQDLSIIISIFLALFNFINCTTVYELIKAEKLEKQLTQLYQQGHFKKAIPIAQEVISIRIKIYGSEHPDVAQSLNNLGLIYDTLGYYAQAESLYQRALTILEKKLGSDHKNVASCLNNLAALYRNIGAYNQAEPLYKRSLQIKEKQLGPDHHSVAKSLNNLALLYYEMGSYTQAEKFFKQALTILKNQRGPEHPDVAICLNNLALLYKTIGDFIQAEPLYRQALKIKENQLGPEHPSIAKGLNNLAALYHSMGAYDRAEPLYLRALTIREKQLGSEHPDVAETVKNLAELYVDMGADTMAESLYQRALEIREKKLGLEHPDVSNSLNALGLFYTLQGAFSKAEQLFQRSLEICENHLNPEHPDLARSLNNLALLYYLMGDYFQAEPMYKRVLTITEKQLGPEHPEVAQCINNLIYLWASIDKIDSIIPSAKRLSTINFHFYHRILPFLSESRQLDFIQSNATLNPLWPSLYLKYGAYYKSIRSILCEVILNQKGLIFEILSKRFINGRNTNLNNLQDSLYQVRVQLANNYYADPKSEESLENRVKGIQYLYAKEQKLADEFAEKSYLPDTLKSPITDLQIRQALVEDIVVVDFCYFQNLIATPKNHELGKEYYLAIVYQNNKETELIHLGEADPINQSTIELLKLIYSTKYNKFQTREQNFESEVAIKIKARQLYRKLFQPILGTIGNKRNLVICADGPLHYLPFGVMVDEKNRYLVESCQFHYISSSRDILKWSKEHKTLNQDAVIIAKSKFQQKYPELKFSLIEAIAIDSLLKINNFVTKINLDNQAMESILKSIKSPQILHISTHGFFKPAPDELHFDRIIGLASFQKTIRKGLVENPLLRSGLILTSSNQDESGQTNDDGIATALEISGLDLTNTNLVTLSACQTGFGDLKQGEGLYGLHRSFMLAGAKTVLASLWSVPDLETKDLMIEFYRRYLSDSNTSKTEALRQAQLAVIKSLREKYGVAPPAYWGAFVCIGEP